MNDRVASLEAESLDTFLCLDYSDDEVSRRKLRKRLAVLAEEQEICKKLQRREEILDLLSVVEDAASWNFYKKLLA